MTRAEMDELLIAEVWPCCWPAVSVFVAMSTQWRQGFGGETGLDYNALPIVMEMRRIPKQEWPAIFDDIRVLEIEALKALTEQREEQNG